MFNLPIFDWNNLDGLDRQMEKVYSGWCPY